MPHNKFAGKISLKTIAGLILVLMVAVFIILAVCAGHTSRRQDTISVEFYFMGTNNTGIHSEERMIPDGSQEELLSSVLAGLKEGPKAEGLQASVPSEITFNHATIDGDTVILDISDSYNKMKNGEEVICRSSIVWTLTSLDFIQNVVISVDGKELTMSTGEPIGPMNRKNVVINAAIAPESKRYETVKLYFANSDGNMLVPENREIEVSQNQPKEKSVMEQLIAGPEEKGHTATLPSDVKLKEITITDDGMCYVNFSEGFLTKHPNGQQRQTMMVYSIVNSLTSLPKIDKVQFLIEGEKIEEDKGILDFSKPFEANTRLEKKES